MYHHRLLKHLTQYFLSFQSYSKWFYIFLTASHHYLLFLSLSPSLTLNALTYPYILDNVETDGLITLSKYPIKYFELVFVSSNFGRTILSTLTSQIFIAFLHHKYFLLILLSRQYQHY